MESSTVSVVDFITKDGIIKHVQYNIKGTDSFGEVNTMRRYKDFTYLRKVLVSSWPGCFIPQIPGKKMIVFFI